jgi:8-oxo-dGTP pyrophosphatase MutT (NUDIX family)
VTAVPRIYDVDRLDCRLVSHRWAWAEAQAEAIERHWAERRRVNPSLYDGPVLLACRAEIVEEQGETVLRVEAFETRFSQFLGWRDFGWPDRGVFNFFAMPAVRARDGAFLAGKMGPGHSAAGQVYFPAGTPDPSDVVDGATVDLSGSLVRELFEETGLRAAEGAEALRWLVIFEGQRLACIKEIAWPATADELGARVRAFLAAEAKPELADAVLLRPGEVGAPTLLPFMNAFLARAANPKS